MTKKILVVAALVLIFIVGALSYVYVVKPRALREAQRDKLYEAIGLLVASANSADEFKRRSPEVTVAAQRMAELDPDFVKSQEAEELATALSYAMESALYADQDEVRNKKLLMRLSEVSLQEPSEESRQTYRQLVAYGVIKKGDELSVSLQLDPWAYGWEVGIACTARAAIALQNAKIHAGRLDGKLTEQPPARSKEDWVKFLPPEHPEKPK